jgi:hypothetical protein
MLAQNGAQHRGAGATPRPLEQLVDLGEVEEALDLGLVAGSLDDTPWRNRGKLQQRQGDRRARDSLVHDAIASLDVACDANVDAGDPPAAVVGHDHLDQPLCTAPQAEMVGRRAVAQHGAGPAASTAAIRRPRGPSARRPTA